MTETTQSEKLIDVEQSRHLAEGMGDPCVALVKDDEGHTRPCDAELATAGRGAGWQPMGTASDFAVRLVARMVAASAKLDLLPRVDPGDPTAELRWSTWRTFLAGFGHGGWAPLVNVVLRVAVDCPFDPAEDYESWYKSAINARHASGLPLSAPRMPWRAWVRAAADEGFNPFYLRHIVLWHLVRHTYRSADGLALHVVYKSAGETVEIKNPLSAFNGLAIAAMRSALALPAGGSKKSPNPLGLACNGVLARLVPDDFLRQQPPLGLDPHVMPGPGARLSTSIVADTSEVEHAARLTGVVMCVDGAPVIVAPDDQTADDLFTWDWMRPFDHGVDRRQRAWLDALPQAAPDGRPSQILQRAFPNLRFLSDDHACLLDAVIVCDLIRRRDRDGQLARELPLIAVLPSVPTIEGSTNTGKTALVGTIARAFHADSTPMMVADSSAPTKRAIAASVEHHGFVALDEWKLPPENTDHLLSRQGLQTLCTGGEIKCGKVYSNEDHSIRLQSPIVLNAKYLPLPDDMLLRCVYLWIDPRGDTGEAEETARRWAEIVSGRLSLELRLSALRMLDQWPGIDALSGRAPSERQWRMVAHRMCAARICAHANSVSLDEALVRIDAAVHAQVHQHQQLTQAAIDSGLVARYENPMVGTFDLGAVFEAIQPNVEAKHRAAQLETTIKTASAFTPGHGRKGTFTAPALARAIADYMTSRGFAGKSLTDVFAYLLGPRFGGLSDKEVGIRMREALVGACPAPGSRWPLPGIFGIDGWYLERLPQGSDGSKLFTIACLNP